MVTKLCFGLTSLLIPLLIELFNLQANLHLSNTGHALIEVLILGGVYWLFMQILRLDEWLYLRNLIQAQPYFEPVRSNTRLETLVQPAAPAARTQPRQLKAAALHWPRIPFENELKKHRMVKP